jgi:hypothetical protein
LIACLQTLGTLVTVEPAAGGSTIQGPMCPCGGPARCTWRRRRTSSSPFDVFQHRLGSLGQPTK